MFANDTLNKHENCEYAATESKWGLDNLKHTTKVKKIVLFALPKLPFIVKFEDEADDWLVSI
jgi:hypothetical protein